MKLEVLLNLCILFYSVKSGTIQQCTEYTAVASHKTKQIYVQYYYSCGWNGWSLCSGKYSYTIKFPAYIVSKECCKGYSGLNCTAFCSFECGFNSECTLPQTCTCVDGWEGSDCLTDIDECAEGIDLCEIHDNCVNHEGNYSCGCYGNQILGNDGHRCLDAVQDLHLVPGKRDILLEFELPEDFFDDGDLEGFSVNCSMGFTSNESTFIGNSTNLTMTELVPFTRYTCCVRPQWTDNGEGPEACAETDTLQDAPDDPPQNVSIMVTSERSVLIQWKPPNIPNGIIEQYRLYINYTNSTALHHIDLSSKYTLFLHEYLKPHQTIGVGITAFTAGGEGPISSYMYASTFQDVPGAVDDLMVKVLASYAINVTWNPPKALNGILLKYFLNITKETTTVENFYFKELEPYEKLHVSLHGLDPYVPYTISVAASTIIGWGEVYPVTVFTSQQIPSVGPTITSAEFVSPTLITISWNPLTHFQLRGFLSTYQVVLAESINQCNDTANMVLTNTTSSLMSLPVEPLIDYCVSVKAATYLGFGPSSISLYLEKYESSLFEVHFKGVNDCRYWIDEDYNHKLNAVTEVLVNSLNTKCSCKLQTTYFGDSQFICNELDEHRVVFQGRVAGTVKASSAMLVSYVQEWINESPIVAVQGALLSVDNNCSAKIERLTTYSDRCVTLHEETEEPPTSPSVSGFGTERILSIIFGVGITLCIVIISMLLAFICYKRILSSRKENLADTDSDRLNIIFDRTLETENDSKDESGVKMFTFDEGDLY